MFTREFEGISTISSGNGILLIALCCMAMLMFMLSPTTELFRN